MNDLSALFNKNPLELTNPEILVIIEAMRAARANFNAVPEKPKKAAVVKPKMEGVVIDLAELKL